MQPDRSAPGSTPGHAAPLAASPARSAPGEPDAFELWLRRGLQARFATIVAEPLPSALLELASQATAAAEDRFDQRVRERAYFLWLGEGRPEGRALEHWMAAFMREVAAEVDRGCRAPGFSGPPRAGRARSGRG
ncbi:DUF2934 domain-containing protein [Dankookia rubra]|uniref:DUF2934 domain-containing protein n=1 Tax=Dankookia rubra TaxID=1442381 RepID=A0A4R5QA17_9PROT|nr:DUF2934 domain-containing protein [Dankookia rubra]TDH59503.1 DUF2934 domain-containing protein [Dankookia rubra]